MRIILTCFLIASVFVASDAWLEWLWPPTPPPIDSGSGGHCNNLKMVTRSEWGAQPLGKDASMTKPVERLVIHHTAEGNCSGRLQCDELVMKIQEHHKKFGYKDIIYNFLISSDGLVYEGCGWNRAGSISKYFYTQAVAFIGDFTIQTPTAESLQAAKDLMNCGIDTNKLTIKLKVKGHNEVVPYVKNCPGRHLTNEIKTWPEYSEI